MAAAGQPARPFETSRRDSAGRGRAVRRCCCRSAPRERSSKAAFESFGGCCAGYFFGVAAEAPACSSPLVNAPSRPAFADRDGNVISGLGMLRSASLTTRKPGSAGDEPPKLATWTPSSSRSEHRTADGALVPSAKRPAQAPNEVTSTTTMPSSAPSTAQDGRHARHPALDRLGLDRQRHAAGRPIPERNSSASARNSTRLTTISAAGWLAGRRAQLAAFRRAAARCAGSVP